MSVKYYIYSIEAGIEYASNKKFMYAQYINISGGAEFVCLAENGVIPM